MMESLRNFLTGPRLIIVVLVCALPFVFLGTSSLSTAFTGSFGSINGEDVSETDIQMAAKEFAQDSGNTFSEEDYDFGNRVAYCTDIENYYECASEHRNYDLKTGQDL